MANVYTNLGRGFAAGVLSGIVSQITTFYGNVGTGAGTAAVADTALFTEVGSSRISCTSTNPTTTLTGDTARNVFTYTASGSVTVTNAGVFTASTSGTLLQKSDFTGVALSAADSIQLTFECQVT